MTQLLIPVLVGSKPPEEWDAIEAQQQAAGESANSWLRSQHRPSIAELGSDWQRLGLEPRWVGYDTVDCAVALSPSIFSGQGADEFNRFRQGAEHRGDVALVVSPIGKTALERELHNIFGDVVSVHIGQTDTSVSGRAVGKGAKPRMADHLGGADAQLALRLLNCPTALTWRTLTLSGAVSETAHGRKQHEAEGTLIPILETEMGEPVVAAWVSPDGVERRYLVPIETPWPLVTEWLLQQALPEFVPGAMRRARRPLADDVDLMTRGEKEAHAALKQLETYYAHRRVELENQVDRERDRAASLREGLLYGSGRDLEQAVRAVFESAGIHVTDLDDELGGTKNADLLCVYEGRARIVEVKSANGSASENAYQDLIRHLREWPTLSEATPVDGGALVMSHELRREPLERTPRPYARPEFLNAQTEPIISAVELFNAWRLGDDQAIRSLLFGSQATTVSKGNDPVDEREPTRMPPLGAPERRRWFRLRGGEPGQ